MYKILIAMMLPLFLTACPALLLGGGVAGAGYVASQDRTVGRIQDDSTLFAKVKAKLADDKTSRFRHVNVKVNEARVLLAGHVHTREAKKDAVNAAWSIEGVQEVINDLRISQNYDEKRVSEYAGDTAITTAVKAKLLVAENITSANFSVDTIEGTVYIMGRAHSKAELDKVISIAQNVRGVKKVVSHAKIVNENTAPVRTQHNHAG